MSSALDKLRGGLSTSYKSTFFDNTSEDFENEVKLSISRQEEIFFTEFKKSSISLFQQCKALNEINQALKKDGLFMEWCKHVCLTKDKASELLKRHELYRQFPENHLWVSSLSVSAVKILTHKNLEIEQLNEIAELELRSVDEIREFLIIYSKDSQENTNEKTVVVDAEDEDIIISEFKELKNKIKTLKSSNNIKQYKSHISSVRRELEELEALIKEQEEADINKNNLNLFEDGLQ